MTPAGFPHSDTPGSTLGCQLPRAYRRLLRPSSALDAKASTMCPSQLVTHTTNPTPTHSNNHHTGSHHHTPEPDRRCTPHTHHHTTHTNHTHTSQTHTNMSLPTCAANVRRGCFRGCDTAQGTNTHPPQSQRM